MREWLSWWSTTLPRSGSRVRVPSRALFIPIKVVETLMIAAFHLFIFLQFRIELEIIELFLIKMVIYYMDLEMLSESCNQLLHML